MDAIQYSPVALKLLLNSITIRKYVFGNVFAKKVTFLHTVFVWQTPDMAFTNQAHVFPRKGFLIGFSSSLATV